MEKIASFIHDCQVSMAQELLKKEAIESMSKAVTADLNPLMNSMLGPKAFGTQSIMYDLFVDPADVLRARIIIDENMAMLNQIMPLAKTYDSNPSIPKWMVFIVIGIAVVLGVYMIVTEH